MVIAGVLVCARKAPSSRLPLTLTLSPHAGRGDVPHDTGENGSGGACRGPFSPLRRRRCRQAD
ncbi:hypothetical protein F2981_08635 [Sinorhizobium meliloti]|nr:hypothetical protein [Sinorhizobium meliloti]